VLLLRLPTYSCARLTNTRPNSHESPYHHHPPSNDSHHPPPAYSPCRNWRLTQSQNGRACRRFSRLHLGQSSELTAMLTGYFLYPASSGSVVQTTRCSSTVAQPQKLTGPSRDNNVWPRAPAHRLVQDQGARTLGVAGRDLRWRLAKVYAVATTRGGERSEAASLPFVGTWNV
jgi:hypothetical protein